MKLGFIGTGKISISQLITLEFVTQKYHLKNIISPRNKSIANNLEVKNSKKLL